MSGAFIQWAALSAVVASAGFAFTMILHIIKYAEEKGAQRERIQRLEQEMKEQKGVANTVVKLDHTVSMLSDVVGELKHFMQEMLKDRR